MIEIFAQELYNGYGSCSEGMGKDDIGWSISEELRKKYPSQSAFIDRILPSVLKIHEQTGIPWQFLIAQVCHESGYGKYEIKDIDSGEYSKNLFGIKYFGDTSDKSKYVRSWTWEEIKPSELEAWQKSHPELKNMGKNERGNLEVKIIANFAKYDSYENAFEGYKKILLNSHFKHALRSNDDPIQYAKDLQSQLPGENHAKYALDTSYVSKITDMMKMWKMVK